jgi:hypothetical protein
MSRLSLAERRQVFLARQAVRARPFDQAPGQPLFSRTRSHRRIRPFITGLVLTALLGGGFLSRHMELNLTTPLLTALALINLALIFHPVSRRMKLLIGVAMVGLSSLLLKDWLDGLLYILHMP